MSTERLKRRRYTRNSGAAAQPVGSDMIGCTLDLGDELFGVECTIPDDTALAVSLPAVVDSVIYLRHVLAPAS